MGAAQTKTTEMVVKLFIKDPGGEITEIKLRDSEFESYTVLQLKTKIQEKTTRDFQELIFKRCLLKDAAKLSDYGIQHESTIQILNKHLTKKLNIKDMRGKTIRFCLDEDQFKSCLVEHLKRRILDIWGIPEDQQRLSYAGKQLEGGCTMFEYGIRHESTIHLIVRPRMGLPDPEKADGGMGDKGGTNRIKIMGAAQTNTAEMVVKLFIRELFGKTLMIELSDSEYEGCTVLQLKTKIREKTGNPEDQQRLSYAGKQLEGGCTMFEYGIRHESTIHLIVRPRMGLPDPEKADGGMGDKGGTNRIKIMGAAQTNTAEMVVKLFIRELFGKTLMIELSDSEYEGCTVLQLKTKIREKTGNPEDQQRLIFQGIELTDDCFLHDYGIQNDSLIHLILKLRGGGPCLETGDGGMGDKGGKNRSMEHLYYF